MRHRPISAPTPRPGGITEISCSWGPPRPACSEGLARPHRHRHDGSPASRPTSSHSILHA
ncbi:hypothetical protein AAFF_G00117080 [Aldrovandia affinis]|uniref:Uncharacterized protein n=1 Tax=Aldrovandia affinis TaxID=143900 RepID=A0AAD7T1M5_9TELE|nr:hypothetical protein AAFF_G00117080 [Aldrovandia affinis]